MSVNSNLRLSGRARKSTGSHYTPSILSDFVAHQIVDAWASKKSAPEVCILDPAVGDGELLHSIMREASNQMDSKLHIFGFETNEAALNAAKARIRKCFPKARMSMMCESFLDFVLESYGLTRQNTLFERMSVNKFDLVIANPPYVRTQVMGAKRASELSRRFNLSGRVDLYYAFIQGIAATLRPGGIAGIIVSNRFMTTKSGASIRASIREEFDILHVWDMGDTKLFEAAVLPAVLLLRKKDKTGNSAVSLFTTIYTTRSEGESLHCESVIDAINCAGIVDVKGGKRFLVQHGSLDCGSGATGVWRIATPNSDAWLEQVDRHTFCTFGYLGKVRVGVKTCADKVFIGSHWDQLPENRRPELLRPLATHHVARRFRAIVPELQQRILYTHEVVGGKRVAVDLKKYPRTAQFLRRFRAELEARKYVLDAGRNWYEIWVPQDPNAWTSPKLVFPDISERPTFWMDLTGSVVNGDCYWLMCENVGQTELLWLALAVANSSFIETYYDHRFNNKLYAGRRRFITQYVQEFPLPSCETDIGKELIEIAKRIYELTPSREASRLERRLNDLVWFSFGFSLKETSR